MRSVPYGVTAPSNEGINSSRTQRAETLQSSVTSFGGVSMFGSEANPKDVQELLDNLERATNLIRNHLQEQEAPTEHV